MGSQMTNRLFEPGTAVRLGVSKQLPQNKKRGSSLNPNADAAAEEPGAAEPDTAVEPGPMPTPPMPALERFDSSQQVNKIFKTDVPSQPAAAAALPATKAKRGSRLNPNAA